MFRSPSLFKKMYSKNGKTVSIRPAICDKARKKQQGAENLPLFERRIQSFGDDLVNHHRRIPLSI